MNMCVCGENQCTLSGKGGGRAPPSPPTRRSLLCSMVAEFMLSGDVGYCNAIRRTLIGELHTEAPFEVLVRCNTSCQTDEFLAHRIGLIPFRRVGNGDSMTLRVSAGNGSTTATAGDLVGCAFEPVHPTIPIMLLGAFQKIDLTVFFDCQSTTKHVRYCPCAAVGMQSIDTLTHRLTFETLGAQAPPKLLLGALDHFEARVDRALKALAHQPATPPKTHC